MCCGEFFNSSWWWVWPVLMMAVCFFLMRRWRGPMMCGFGPRPKDWHQYKHSDTASDILDKRFAAGEIDEIEFKAKKRSLNSKSGIQKGQGA